MSARFLLMSLLLTPLAASAADPPPAKAIRVTVVVVFATTENNNVDPRLAPLAREVTKQDPTLIGFKLACTHRRSIPVGGSHTFKLPNREALKLTVRTARGADGRVRLTVAPPGVGEVTYSCKCDRYFPVATPTAMPSGEQVIVAIMAKPCTGAK